MKNGFLSGRLVLVLCSCERSVGTKEQGDGGIDAAWFVDSGEIPDADMADAFPQTPVVEDPFNIFVA